MAELPFEDIFFGIGLGFDAIALLFVLLAGIELLYHFLKTPKSKKSHTLPDKKYHAFRRVFVHRVILALDFFLIADMMKLAFIDTIPGLIQILFIVVIRSILSYFLMRETGDM
jgi:uncharacterized membrane protein